MRRAAAVAEWTAVAAGTGVMVAFWLVVAALALVVGAVGSLVLLAIGGFVTVAPGGRP